MLRSLAAVTATGGIDIGESALPTPAYDAALPPTVPSTTFTSTSHTLQPAAPSSPLVVVEPEAAASLDAEPAAVERPAAEALPGPEAWPAAVEVLTVTAPAPGGPLEAAEAPFASR